MRQSTPGACHHIGIVKLEASRCKQQLDKVPPLLQLDHLVKGRIHGVRQRARAENLLGRLDLGEINLKRRLALRCSGHPPSIADNTASR